MSDPSSPTSMPSYITSSSSNICDCFELAIEGERLCKARRFADGILKLEEALHIGSDDLNTISAIYTQLGNAYFSIRNYTKAQEYYTYDIKLARIMGDIKAEAMACGNLGNALKLAGDFDVAQRFTQRQLELARKAHNIPYECAALYHLGSFHLIKAKKMIKELKGTNRVFDITSIDSHSLQDSTSEIVQELDSSMNYFKQYLEYAKETKDRVACGRAYGNIGNVHYLRKEYELAIENHLKRLEIAREFGDKPNIRRAYSSLGNSHILINQLDKAIEFYRMALTIAMELKDQLSEAQVSYCLANTAALNEDYQTAADYHCRHMMIARRCNDRSGEVQAYLALGSDYRKLGDLPTALYFLSLARRCSKDHNFGDLLAQAENMLREVIDEGQDAVIINGRELVMDSKADPGPAAPHRIRLSVSLHSLLDEAEDCGISRRSAFQSDSELSNVGKAPMTNEDFFEMLTRMQSKRMDDQRCDVSVLGDRTNTKRQTDTISALNETFASTVSKEKKNRRLSLISLKKSAVRFSSSVLHGSLMRQMSKSTINSDRSTSTVDLPHLMDTMSFDEGPSHSGEEVVFRPPLPPKDSSRRHTIHEESPTKKTKKHDDPDALIEQLMQAQGRRMEEQRAHLLPGVHNGRDLLNKLSAPELEGSGIDNELLELLSRMQSQRMNEQRSELGGRQKADADEPKPCTLPDDEMWSDLIHRMQAGRIEEQRAHLPSEPSPPSS